MENQTDTTRFDLTDEEVEAFARATPKQIAEAAAELARDPEFWKEMAQEFAAGLLRGLLKD